MPCFVPVSLHPSPRNCTLHNRVLQVRMPCFVPVSLHPSLLRLSRAPWRTTAVSAVSLQAVYKYEPLPVALGGQQRAAGPVDAAARSTPPVLAQTTRITLRWTCVVWSCLPLGLAVVVCVITSVMPPTPPSHCLAWISFVCRGLHV